MELVLTKNAQHQITVTCDGQPSHTFFWTDLLLPQRQDDQRVLNNPVETGARLFTALFADGSPAHTAWSKHPKCILDYVDPKKVFVEKANCYGKET